MPTEVEEQDISRLSDAHKPAQLSLQTYRKRGPEIDAKSCLRLEYVVCLQLSTTETPESPEAVLAKVP